MTLGELLRSARAADGLSQVELARLAGVSGPALRLCERSRGQLRTFLALLDALGRRLHWEGLDHDGSIGAQLAARRKARGYSQRSAAKMIGCTPPTIVALERELRGRVETVDRYLRMLRLRPTLIRPGEPEAKKPQKRRLIPARNSPDQDRVYTPRDLARSIIEHFSPEGIVLDPCRGDGSFYDQFPKNLDARWCEVEQGRDFFDYHLRVDWIITNPPWSKLREFLVHAMSIADNVVFLATINHFSTSRRRWEMRNAGFGMREVHEVPAPTEGWPSSGFQLAAIHIQRGWTGPCEYSGDLDTDALAGRAQKGLMRPFEQRPTVPVPETYHSVLVEDCLATLRRIPDDSVQLIVCDPPYNISMAEWDDRSDYLPWAREWLREAHRVLKPNGNFVIFGGLQYQGMAGSGDLLSIVNEVRQTNLFNLVNMIIWNYAAGKGSDRFFASRHEHIVWFTTTSGYYFDLDPVREPYDDAKREAYAKDQRLSPEAVDMGRNPTNVWRIPRLTANSRERVGHPTQKPVALIERLIRSMSPEGSVVLDFFAGSGVTTRVAMANNRHSIAVDQDERLLNYLGKHLENWERDVPPDRHPRYTILSEEDFASHPVFRSVAPLVEAAE